MDHVFQSTIGKRQSESARSWALYHKLVRSRHPHVYVHSATRQLPVQLISQQNCSIWLPDQIIIPLCISKTIYINPQLDWPGKNNVRSKLWIPLWMAKKLNCPDVDDQIRACSRMKEWRRVVSVRNCENVTSNISSGDSVNVMFFYLFLHYCYFCLL